MSESPVAPDPDAQRYHDHWQPVLDDPAQRLLGWVATVAADLLEPARLVAPNLDEPSQVASRPVLLDVGAGTGAITLAATQRWPGVRVLGLDASAGMLSVARQRAAHAGIDGDSDRLDWLVADAASLALEDASVDVAVSSFVLQLVSDREAVLSQLHRVLRPGGVFAFVTWLAEELRMGADEAFDEAVYELELDDPESTFREPKPGDYESLGEAEQELHRAGFERVEVRADALIYRWTREAYLEFKRSFDEREMFESLDAADQARLARRVSERWVNLPDSAFVLEAPLVSAIAYRP